MRLIRARGVVWVVLVAFTVCAAMGWMPASAAASKLGTCETGASVRTAKNHPVTIQLLCLVRDITPIHQFDAEVVAEIGTISTPVMLPYTATARIHGVNGNSGSHGSRIMHYVVGSVRYTPPHDYVGDASVLFTPAPNTKGYGPPREVHIAVGPEQEYDAPPIPPFEVTTCVRVRPSALIGPCLIPKLEVQSQLVNANAWRRLQVFGRSVRHKGSTAPFKVGKVVKIGVYRSVRWDTLHGAVTSDGHNHPAYLERIIVLKTRVRADGSWSVPALRTKDLLNSVNADSALLWFVPLRVGKQRPLLALEWALATAAVSNRLEPWTRACAVAPTPAVDVRCENIHEPAGVRWVPMATHPPRRDVDIAIINAEIGRYWG